MKYISLTEYENNNNYSNMYAYECTSTPYPNDTRDNEKRNVCELRELYLIKKWKIRIVLLKINYKV